MRTRGLNRSEVRYCHFGSMPCLLVIGLSGRQLEEGFGVCCSVFMEGNMTCVLLSAAVFRVIAFGIPVNSCYIKNHWHSRGCTSKPFKQGNGPYGMLVGNALECYILPGSHRASVGRSDLDSKP